MRILAYANCSRRLKTLSAGRPVRQAVKTLRRLDGHPVRVKGAVVPDLEHLVIGMLVGPHGVLGAVLHAPVAGVALEGAMRAGVGGGELAEVDVGKGNIDHRLVAMLLE